MAGYLNLSNPPEGGKKMKSSLDELRNSWNRRTRQVIEEAMEKKRRGEKVDKLVV